MVRLFASVLIFGALTVQAEESPDEWGAWAIPGGVALVEDAGVISEGAAYWPPRFTDFDNSIQQVGAVESARNDVGGTLNDLIEDVQLADPTASVQDIIQNIPDDLGDYGTDLDNIVPLVVDRL